jgi:NAD(P)-dependent dehydrogenase (short-subunit alcohol dehydrogenase family)
MASKVALITGGAAGFGLAITEKLLSQGYRVLVVDISVPADSTDGDRIVLCGDVTKKEDWARAVNTVLEKWGKLDVVVGPIQILAIGLHSNNDVASGQQCGDKHDGDRYSRCGRGIL